VQDAPWQATPDMLARYNDMQLQYQQATHDQRQQQFTCGIMLQSIACLLPDECINANVLSEYMKRLMCKAGPLAAAGKAVSVHIFDVSFMDLLWLSHQQRVDYEAVRRYTLPMTLCTAGQVQQSVLDCSLLIAPCHLRGGKGHWVLVVADLRNKTIMYIDPLQVGCMRLQASDFCCDLALLAARASLCSLHMHMLSSWSHVTAACIVQSMLPVQLLSDCMAIQA
jgi:Ulp1 family protease